MSNRTLLKLATLATVGAAGLGSVSTLAAAAPITSPHALADGRELTFADPWTVRQAVDTMELTDGLVLDSGQATLIVGYYDEPATAADVAARHAADSFPDPSVAPAVAGGASTTVGSAGEVELDTEYQVHVFADDSGTQFGILYQIVNGADAVVLFAPIAEFDSFVSSAQASVAVAGVPVLVGIDGAEIREDLEASVDRLQTGDPGAVVDVDVDQSERGEFTDATGGLNVTWPADWSVISYNDAGTELANPEETFVVYLQVVPFDGMNWEQALEADVDFLAGDQGPNVTLVGPAATENGFSFTSDGDYGLRLVEATAIADDPDHYVLIFIADLATDGDPLGALTETQAAIVVNDGVPLQAVAELLAPGS